MDASANSHGRGSLVFRLSCPYQLECSDLFRQLPNPSLVLAPDLSIAAATNDYLDATMTTEGDLLGRHMFDAFPDNTADSGASGVANLSASFERVVQTKSRDRMGLQRYDIRTKEGSFELRYWLPVNAPILDDDGDVRWIVHQVEDITQYVQLKAAANDARLADEALQRDLQAVEAEIGQRMLELRRELQTSREASEAKSRLLSAVCHDLRQPAQAAALFAGSLKSLPLPDGAHERIRLIETSLGTLDRMLSDLLDLSRLEANKVKPQVVPFCLTGLLERLADEFQPLAEAKGVAFRYRCCPFTACSDPVLLEQILRNLIANAIKYTSKGAVALLCRKVGREVRISICDTGIGIPADQTERIFEDYVQLKTAGSHPGGLGIGLATVARTAKLLGHGLTVRSRPGHGSIFSIRLPSAEAWSLRVG
ncbi:MAG: ATP-binding protein [Solirubrobacterales bacterium]